MALVINTNLGSINGQRNLNGAGAGGAQPMSYSYGTEASETLDSAALTAGDNISAYGGDDTIIGSPFGDWIDGGEGNDSISAGDGNDTLNDFGGSNSIDGGAGDDVFNVYSTNSNDSSTLTGGAGTDRFNLLADSFGSLTITDFSSNDDVLGIEDIINNCVGYLSGNLFGSQGYLRLQTVGSDTLLQWDKDGAVLGNPNSPWQTLVTLVGVVAVDLTSNNFSTPMLPTGTVLTNQTITGTTNDEILLGNVGDDSITGNGGADQIYGSDGNDTIAGAGYLVGGAGNDVITSISSTNSNGNVVYNELQGDTGNDTLIGSSGDDYFYDYSGSNSVDGGAGNDYFSISSDDNAINISTISGGAGSDTFYLSANNLNTSIVTDFAAGVGGDVINVNALLTHNTTYTTGDPFDTSGYLRLIQHSANTELQWDKDGAAGSTSSWVTALTLNNLSVTSLVPANNFVSGINNVNFTALTNHYFYFGSTGSDTLIGSNVSDTLDDGDNGGNLSNQLSGGKGDDIYFVHSSGTRVVGETNIGGIDTVQSDVDFTLPKNVENLKLNNSGFGKGNNLNNSIVGSAGADTLNGGAGADTLVGESGDDTYIVDCASDVVTENLNAGIDTVTSIVTYTLPDNVEHLTLNGLAKIDGTGNGLANVILGNSVANTLLGIDGNDSLNGFDGNDSLVGGAGSDTLIGGLGVDTLTGGAEADTFRFSSRDESGKGALRDVITDFQTGIDKIDLSGMNINGSVGTNAIEAFKVRWSFYTDYAVVQADTSENTRPIEFEIKLNGVTTLTNSDFIFAP